MFQPGLSDWGWANAVSRERLISDLLFRVSGVQVGDDGYEAQLEACTRALQHLKHLDTNPGEVDDLYRRLLDRLGEFAQFDKQRALGLLQRRLVSLDIQSSQYDFPHRLLAFLYSAAQAPLGAEYEGSALVDRLLREAEAAGHAQPTYLSDDSTSEGSWAGEQRSRPDGAASDADSLSDWGEEDGEAEASSQPGAGSGGLAAAVGRVEGGMALSSAAGPIASASVAAAEQHQPASPSVLDRRRQLARPAPPPRANPYRRDSLSVWLASRQSGGHPARVLNPQLCFTQGELLQQVLHMLKGISQAGPAFQLDPVRGAYTVLPGVHLHSSSPGATRALLQRFADLGSALRGVQEFCAGVLAPPGAGSNAGEHGAAGAVLEELGEEALAGADSQLRQLSTVAAFAAAMDAELKALQQQLVPLELAARSGALTLLQLQHQLEGPRRQALALQAAARQCTWRGGAAETAAGLLDALHGMVQDHMLQAASQGGAPAAMLLNVFVATVRPYLDRLHAFVFNGDLSEDTQGELFITADPSIAPTSPKFWSAAFSLRRGAGGAPVAPEFLAPLAESLLAGGKSTGLLRAAATLAPAAPAEVAAVRARAGWGAFVGPPPPPRPLRSWESVGGSTVTTPRGLPSLRAPVQREESPTKRRLTAIHALGYDRALAEPDYTTTLSQQLAVGAAGGDGRLPPAAAELEELGVFHSQRQSLHAYFVGGLHRLMQPPAGPASATLPTGPGLGGSLEAAGGRGTASAAATEPPLASSSGSDGSAASDSLSSSAAGEDDESWLLSDAATACSAHTLVLCPAEDLPPLPPLPRRVQQLQTPQALISPEALPPLSLTTPAEISGPSVSAEQQQQQQQPPGQQRPLSIADRMRQAAQQRDQQANDQGSALEQLPSLLLQPPAALGQAAAALGSEGDDEGGPVDAGNPPKAPPAFDISSWAAWHQRVSAALSSQLAAIDAGLGPGGGQRGSGGALVLGGLGLGRLAYQPGGALGRPATRLLKGEDPRISPAMCTYARPLGTLLQQALLNPLHTQAQRIGARMAASLLQQWGLRRQLLTLRELFLLGTPLMTPFLHSLFLKISSRQGLSGVSEFDLNSALQQCFLAAGRADLLAVTAEILPPATTADPAALGSSSSGAKQQATAAAAGAAGAAGMPASAPAMPTAHTLSRLRLGMDWGWPLCLVASEEMLQQYNSALVLLMQVRWVKQSLDTLQRSKWKSPKWRGGDSSKSRGGSSSVAVSAAPAQGAGTGPSGGMEGAPSAPEAGVGTKPVSRQGSTAAAQSAQARLEVRLADRDGVLQQMAHLADAVLQYTWERCLAAWQWLQEALAGCQSLDEVLACHEKYLRVVQRSCLLGQDTLSRLVHDALLRLLDCALHFCWLSVQLARGAAVPRGGEGGEGGGGSAVAAAVAQQGGSLAAVGQAASAARQREAALRGQLAGVRREFVSRQRLLARVLISRASEVGAQAQELHSLLAAIDYNGFFQRGG